MLLIKLRVWKQRAISVDITEWEKCVMRSVMVLLSLNINKTGKSKSSETGSAYNTHSKC